MRAVRIAWAFFKRDLASEYSYRLSFVMQLGGIIFSALTLYFLARLLGRGSLPFLEPYGGDYFAFVLIGVAFGGYLRVAVDSFASCVREAQTLGTLEALLVTQTSVTEIVLFSSLYSFAVTSLRVAVFALVGVLLLGLDLGKANVPAAFCVLVLTIIAFSMIGILSASFIMVFKRGNPVSWLFISLSWLVGGVLYPVAVLPDWLQKVAHALPLTYALEGMRMALLQGYGLRQLSGSVGPLLVFAAVGLPLSLLAFSSAVRRAKVHGSLAHY